MKLGSLHQTIFVTMLLCQFSICRASKRLDLNDPNRYLNAVREFADNVLKYGRDTYGPKHTPLFVDGLMIRDPNNPDYGKVGVYKPVEWIAPNGERWILSNLASQQNLFRTLDGLTRITGDPKYKQAAMDAIKYAFENLRSPNGLLYWGGHSAYDAGADRPCGRGIHEFKGFYPYYKLMWEVDPQATKKFIETFWSGHILNWSNLDMDRHCYNMTQPLNKPWDYEYKGGPVFIVDGAFSGINTGSDLCYAAAWLTEFTGNREPLLWGKRLVYRYTQTKSPEAGLSDVIYSVPKGWRGLASHSNDKILRKMQTVASIFPIASYSNRVYWGLGAGYDTPTPGAAIINTVTSSWICQLMLGELLAEKGKELTKWAIDEFKARGKIAYRKSDNVFIPVLFDGTSIEGYVLKDNGPLGWKGNKLEPVKAGTIDFWAYTLAYCMTADPFMWEMVRNIGIGNGYGDMGVTITHESHLNFQTDTSDPYAIVVFLELYNKTGNKPFLEMAKRIGDNVLSSRLHKGFFVASNRRVYTKFDAIDSLALLHLYSVLAGYTYANLPKVWPATPFLELKYRQKDASIDNQIIYNTLTDSFGVPMSLQEAAAMGDIDLVKTFFNRGVDVNSRESLRGWTALHRASIGNHADIVKLLLAKGANIDVVAGYPEGTALFYAVENGNMGMAELLIGHGADVNARSIFGQTPLDVAYMRNRNDIIELLLANGAESSSIFVAAAIGDLSQMQEFLEEGVDINAKEGPRGQTALHLVPFPVSEFRVFHIP
jgi:pectate lyase